MKKLLLKNSIQLSGQRLLVPFYHMVSDEENTFANYLYPPRKIEVFKKDLDTLLHYFSPVSLEEFIDVSKKKTQHKNVFHLTFDDGLANFYDVVAPILEEKNIPATVFINSDFVDNKALFYRYKASLLIQFYERSTPEKQRKFHDFFQHERDVKNTLLSINHKNRDVLDVLSKEVGLNFDTFLKEKQPYLTTTQIKDLLKRGFSVGAHSASHPLYSDISLSDQLVETQKSIDFLQEKFNVNYKAFAFPFTDLGVTKTFFNKANLDVSFGTSGIKKDDLMNNFQRISFELADDNIENFLLKSYVKYGAKALLSKHKMPRKP